MTQIQRRVILIFLSLFILQILTNVYAQEQANQKDEMKGHGLKKDASVAALDNKDSAQIQQREPPKDVHQVHPHGMRPKQSVHDDLDQPLDYDEVNEMIKKNGAAGALDVVNDPENYMEDEVVQVLDNGPPPQELEPFIEEANPIGTEPIPETGPIEEPSSNELISETNSIKEPSSNELISETNSIEEPNSKESISETNSIAEPSSKSLISGINSTQRPSNKNSISEINSMVATPTKEDVHQAIVVTTAVSMQNTPSASKAPVPQVTGCKTQGQIALTYSEGPSDVTAKIARQLSKADARANFFVNATWLYTQQYALVLQNLYSAGHLIGMTYRVKDDNPSAFTDEDIRNDILNNAQIIEGLIGVAPKYVRLHYTEIKDTRTEGIIRDLGFVIVGYNLDSQDYMKKDATGTGSIQEIYSETFKKYKDTFDSKGSFISIQYDLPYTGSLNAVSHIVNTIDQEGYTMVRLDGCLNDQTPYKKSANSTDYVGDRFSFSHAGYHEGQNPITLDAVDEAEIEEDEFKIQGVTSSASHSKPISYSAFFMVSWVVFTLLL